MRNPSSPTRKSSGKALAGMILVAVGAVLLLHRSDVLSFPSWLFSWPMILIIIGFFVGAKHQFRNPAWLILVTLGIVFMTEKFYPGLNASRYIWPIIIIIFGLFMIMSRQRNHRFNNWQNPHGPYAGPNPDEPVPFYGGPTQPNGPFTTDGPTYDYTKSEFTQKTTAGYAPNAGASDFLSSTSVFGGVKKNIISKNFQGGEITTFMGGAEINLSQADIQGRVVLDVTQVMGGTRIIVPPHWDVISEVAAIFGGVEDKRFLNANTINPNKVLIIRGTSFMGGIDIRSYKIIKPEIIKLDRLWSNP